MSFNEDSRVKIPAILHLIKLGFEYISLKSAKFDKKTNIFTDIFKKAILKINPDIKEEDVKRLYQEIVLVLQNDDLGKAFFDMLISKSIKLIDFENFDNNTFSVVTELTFKKDDEEFRPDITVLINGMPLVFIEVKKPNNTDGIKAERDRLNKRLQNPKFKTFFNMFQFMIFSNNMDYIEQSEPLVGAFYATVSKEPIFNYFREEYKEIYNQHQEISEEIENYVLKDNNLEVIKHSPEFKTNKSHLTPTNKILSSMLHKKRLKFILRYAIAYVKTKNGYQKHIMRYPQIFATFAIKKALDDGVKKGIIWHTQGSGKTALAFYNTRFLSDFFSKRGVIAKFYFIVDRLDLLKQAQKEFTSRGLVVKTIQDKEDFKKEIVKNTAIRNDSGKLEITVVNIQKFDDIQIPKSAYNINIQRVYFIDEAHRSYNPKGSFLSNLYSLDKNAIFIALTGTPLLKKEYTSKDIFGSYLHKYYYNLSIKDGYTLRLIREEIEISYKNRLKEILDSIDILKGSIKKEQVTSHSNYVEPLLEYIVNDFRKFRFLNDDVTTGAMVVCDSSAQAKKMYEIFTKKYAKPEPVNSLDFDYQLAAQPLTLYKSFDKFMPKTAALILYDVDTKKIREDEIEKFKDGKIDILFVYNMLSTGFDAPRLKKLYLSRVIKQHNLLQTLTRVNRVYKNYKFGYIVDFANIKDEFNATNRAYWAELQEEIGDEVENYSNLFKTKEEIEKELDEINEFLFRFDTSNLENFSHQINQIDDIKQIREIVKNLENLKSFYNLSKLFGYEEILQKIDLYQIKYLLNEAKNHLLLLNQKEALNSIETTNILNLALEDIVFSFTKIKEEELKIADELREILRKTREAFLNNFDTKDPEFISLKEELERIFKSKNIFEVTQDKMSKNLGLLKEIYKKIKELNRANEVLRAKYKNDKKFAKIHKKILQNKLLKKEIKIYNKLIKLKEFADEKVLNRSDILENEDYFKRVLLTKTTQEFKKENLDAKAMIDINNLIVNEYINEYKGVLY